MAKMESSLKNMVLVLVVITAVSAGALGSLYEATKEPIKIAKLAKQNKAIKMVVPAFDNDPLKDVWEQKTEEGTLRFFPAKKGDELVGTAVETFTNKGFGGNVKIMIGFTPDGTIKDYMVLEHQETPGLGSKMQEWFRNAKGSILGKNPATAKMTVSKDGGDIDAITAATISSRAFLDAVNRAYNGLHKGGTDSQSGATKKSSNQSKGDE